MDRYYFEHQLAKMPKGGLNMLKKMGLDDILSLSGGAHYFAFGMKNILSRSALGPAAEEYEAGFLFRHAQFLSALLKPHDDHFTYDLRIISHPDVTLYTRGRISISLICRLDHADAEEAGRQRGHLFNLLCATFGEYEFEPLSEKQIRERLTPFDPGAIIEIRRRNGYASLETGGVFSPLTEITLSPDSKPKSTVKLGKPDFSNSVYHISPFIATPSDIGILSKLLLSERCPFAISFRIRPIRLGWGEEQFMEEQVKICEKALQGLGSIPILRLQAQNIMKIYTDRLFGLKNSAALASIEIASPVAIPTSVIDTVGSQITASPGVREGGSVSASPGYFSGGYKIYQAGNRPAKSAFTQIDFDLKPEEPLPVALSRLPRLFDSDETAAFFHFPPSPKEPPLGVPVRAWRAVQPPDNVAKKGCRLGRAFHGGIVQPIWIGPEDRKRHIYVVGQTGTGKTTLFKTMILEDIRAGEGLCVIDPHGDLYKELLLKIPEKRIDDVILIDPTDTDFPVGLNLLECKSYTERYFVAQEFVGIIRRLIHDEYGRHTEMIGPIFFQHMRMNLLLAMSDPDNPGTLLEFFQIFQGKNFWKRWLPLKVDDEVLQRWVTETLPDHDYSKIGSEVTSLGDYIGSKFESFVFDPMLRNIFGQKHNKVDIRAAMDTGKIILVNLAKGELTEENSRFLGMILMAKLIDAAMSRSTIPERDRRQFNLYVDEFQSLATSGFSTLASEARKFGLSLVLANQFLTQIDDPQILRAVFGNVGTLISFRLGQEDAEALEKKFHPAFNRFDLANLPNWTAYISTLIDGQVTPPFSFSTILDKTRLDRGRADIVRTKSRERYTLPRAEVDNILQESLQRPKSEPPGKTRTPLSTDLRPWGIDNPQTKKDED